MLALALGTLLAVGALAYVLTPLFTSPPQIAVRASQPSESASPEGEAVAALREIEFDRATGKLSDSDYAELKDRYTDRALVAMRTETATPADAVEAAVLAYRARLRSCTGCGPRPEPDATYCSNCGRYLPGRCDGCGTDVTESAATFCARCGRQLAA
ncbi:MAG: zinc ribbon domain-containing protein [Gemmatimonadaceae bacterium]|nr:zinc ribbon domain-containing protein [Gemmatimonadaceae bacterium]